MGFTRKLTLPTKPFNSAKSESVKMCYRQSPQTGFGQKTTLKVAKPPAAKLGKIS